MISNRVIDLEEGETGKFNSGRTRLAIWLAAGLDVLNNPAKYSLRLSQKLPPFPWPMWMRRPAG